MKKIGKILVVVLTICTLVSYFSVLVSPVDFRLSAGISVLIPVFLLFNLVAFFVFLYYRSSRLLLPLVLLIIGFPFLRVTAAFNASNSEEGDFSVMSYNVRWFKDGEMRDSDLIHDFLAKEVPDIICLQEFWSVGNHVNDLIEAGGYQALINKNRSNLSIFSKYPVLDHGMLLARQRFNNIQFADLLVEKDTVRVYNLHLQSMGINTSRLQDSEGIREDYELVKTKFLEGASVRARQIDTLMMHVEDCRHKVIIAGDFNDIPFSYNHFRLRRDFTSAFETAGQGFGVTYNGRLPFLRIDHQFYSEGLTATSFKTFSEIAHSDHFPILGIYALSD